MTSTVPSTSIRLDGDDPERGGKYVSWAEGSGSGSQPGAAPTVASQIRTQLQALNLPPPSDEWLQAVVCARSPPAPLASLVMTAKTRLLAADLGAPGVLDPATTCVLPHDITNPRVPEIRLRARVVVQVLDIENLGRSRWDQARDLEACDRGDDTALDPALLLPPPPPPPPPPAKYGLHRLVLQDCCGQTAFGLELVSIPRMAVGMLSIGEKIMLDVGTVVARGTVLLEPATCHLLGGRVDAWHRTWQRDRLKRLKDRLGPAGARDGA